MKILITGAFGFVGKYLTAELIREGHEIFALSDVEPNKSPAFDYAIRDIRDAEQTAEIIKRENPEACIHLAAISFVPKVAENPYLANAVNVGGTLNILEGFRKHKPSARILFVSTSQIYERGPQQKILTEETPCSPQNLYGITKWAAEQACHCYAKQYEMPIVIARPENHTGPGQSNEFAVPSFANQIALRATSGSKNPIHVGNLESSREFTDVRDVVRAYRLLLEKGQPGQAYNISSGNVVKLQEVIDKLYAIVSIRPEIIIDQKLYRPTDHTPKIDTRKIFADTGWKASIPLEQTLQDMIEEKLSAITK